MAVAHAKASLPVAEKYGDRIALNSILIVGREAAVWLCADYMARILISAFEVSMEAFPSIHGALSAIGISELHFMRASRASFKPGVLLVDRRLCPISARIKVMERNQRVEVLMASPTRGLCPLDRRRRAAAVVSAARRESSVLCSQSRELNRLSRGQCKSREQIKLGSGASGPSGVQGQSPISAKIRKSKL